MKYLLLLILTISLSHPTYARTVRETSAPSDKQTIDGKKTGEYEYHEFDNTDSIRTGQSATQRTVAPNTNTAPLSNTPGSIQTTPQGANCVDRSGRSYGANDSGYNACVNSVRMR